jgi:iron transport multicopper oxidase
MRYLSLLISAIYFSSLASCATHVFDFNITWVTVNPDGLAERQVVGINGQWPLPVIEVNKGDQIIANVHNGLGDKNTSIHWHGMFMNGTNEMDGASMVTQCPIGPGSDFTYNFTVNQNGTYWYHCHVDFCYPDGYRQALIVHDPDAYFNDMYAEEFTVTLSDWYHELEVDIEPTFLSLYNPLGAEPLPQSFLFNDTQNTKISVQPNTTYMLRIINIGAFVAQYFYIQDHNFQIIEVDGVYTEPTEADTLYIGVAQRYTILFTTKNSTDQNYPIVTVADAVLLDIIPSNLQLNLTNWLEYNPDAVFAQADITVSSCTDLVPFDDATLVPYDHMPLLPDPDQIIEVTVVMDPLDNGKPYALLTNISYTKPKVPSLYTVLSSGNDSTDATIYGEFTHPFVLNHNSVIEIRLNNNDSGSHPFHLHGHNFQVLTREPPLGADFYDYADLANPVNFDPNNHTDFPEYPIRRDTLVLPPQGYWVARFVADNPGTWLFHCHIDWHMDQGLAAVLIEAPTQLQSLTLPADHLAACKAVGVQSAGNAAGNDEQFTDLAGQNIQPGFQPQGFTPRGEVAMAFAIISALCGIVAIAVYGASGIDLKKK